MTRFSGAAICLLLLVALNGCQSTPNMAGDDAELGVSLTHTLWHLVAIGGSSITAPAVGTELPSLQLEETNAHAAGFTGCNHFAGKYTLGNAQRIVFSQIVTTKRACLEANPEADYLQALEQVNHYTLSGTTLQLNQDRMAPLLTFEAAALP